MNEREKWFELLQEIGCIACLNDLQVRSDADIHHIIHAGKRIDDFHTIPLCPSHHRSGIDNKIATSRHPWKKEFEKRYGTEMELLDQVRLIAKEIVNSRIGGKHPKVNG